MQCEHPVVVETDEAKEEFVRVMVEGNEWPEEEVRAITRDVSFSFGQCAVCLEFVTSRISGDLN
jgi:hypothetical protein